MTEFNIQNHIQSLQKRLDEINDEIRGLQELVSASQQELQEREEAEKTLRTLSSECQEFQSALSQKQYRVDEARETAAVFQMVRNDPQYRSTSMIPEEFNLAVMLQKHQEEQELMTRNLETHAELEIKLANMTPADTLNAEIQHNQLLIRERQGMTVTLNESIRRFQRAQQCFEAQQQLEDALPKYIEYIYENWDEETEDFILQYLQTEGEKKNVPFEIDEITAFIEYIDQVFFADDLVDEYATDEETNIISLVQFQNEIRELKVKPELVVAFANTIRLIQFPQDFFSGLKDKTGSKNASPQGSLPWEARDILIHFGLPIPRELENLLHQNYSYLTRVYYSFHQDTGGKNKRQLYDLRHFLQEFWRFGNFYGFTYNSLLHIHEEKQDPRQVNQDYEAYLRTRRSQGLYLEV